ncbi:hypothetical protein BURK2_01571 [Burkholderiales bacterium]|nr:MAG: hypothetical protein F9K47_17795 [Burkholderiales bacterium]CAG0975936.1 hypothetical protein BURK2_01571 [Burkholderiales bacterium]
MLDTGFIAQLPEDADLALNEICDRFVAFCGTLPEGGALARYEDFIEYYALLQAYAESRSLQLGFSPLKTEKPDNISMIVGFFRRLKTATDLKAQKKLAAATLEAAKQRYARKIEEDRGFRYTLSDGDVDRLRRVLEALRVRVAELEALPREYRDRLARRLEFCRGNLQKSMLDLDALWGLLPEAGILHEKLGEDAAPLVERVFEIATLAWHTQARAAELPSNTEAPFLTLPEAQDEDEPPEIIRAVRHRH